MRPPPPRFRAVSAISARGWCGGAEHNITHAIFTPIRNDATAVAALLSGENHMINPVPVQDAARIKAGDGVLVLRGNETRVILPGFAHDHKALRNGASNPFSDARARRAVAQAVKVDTILQDHRARLRRTRHGGRQVPVA